jgi:FtsP/CotA-like multicopper oxidase with cupredoxin domain
MYFDENHSWFVKDNLGWFLGRRIWLQHYHVSDHMEAGMAARYQVLP